MKTLRRFSSLLTLLAALIVTEISLRSQQLATLNHIYSDSWFQLAGARYTPEHVALVTVDDAALAAMSDTPLIFWTPYFARAAAVLQQIDVKTIGLDFLPAITPETWLQRIQGINHTRLAEYDLSFRQTLQRGDLILVATHQRNANLQQDQLLLPHPDYLLSLPNIDIPRYIGYANLVNDADGSTREYIIRPQLTLAAELRDNAPQLHFAALLAQRHNPRLVLKNGLINYAGPPNHFQTVSISRLLAPNAQNDPAVRALAGKVVIIGAMYQGMGDIHSTPYTRGVFGISGGAMSGAEIQANIVETLLSAHSITPMPVIPRGILFSGLFFLATLLFARIRIWHGLSALLLGAALLWLIGWGLFHADLILPVADLQLGLFSVFALSYARRFTREGREKTKIQQLFRRYVSSAVVEQLCAAEQLPDLGGQIYTVTVLFSDIRNFTTMSEQLTPHEVVEFLNAYFEQICTLVLQHGGSIDKFIGDAIMVQFGAPLAVPDHAQRALSCAVAMADCASQFAHWMNIRFAGRQLPEFKIGIGIHTGDAVVGNIGSQQRMEYTAIGDTVNLASRIENATKELACTILISESTLNASALGAKFRTGKHAEINVKGRTHTVNVIEILAINPESNCEYSLLS